MAIKNENEQTSIAKSISYLVYCLCGRKIFCGKSTTFTRLRLRVVHARRIVSFHWHFSFLIMGAESFLKDHIRLECGDCREMLAELPENHFDALCTDPPYHLTSIIKRFGAPNAAPVKVP